MKKTRVHSYAIRRQSIVDDRERAINGKLNCLPLPFKRMAKLFPGFRQYMYAILTANQKVGKTKLADYLFVHYPVIARLQGIIDIKTHVLYFSLEDPTSDKEDSFYSNLLWAIDKISVDSNKLHSVGTILNQSVVDKLDSETYQKYISEYEKTVEYISDEMNPTGIYKYCKNYASQHGHNNYVEGKQYDEVTNTYIDGKVINKTNPFTWDDPEQYNIIIIDNFATLTSERGWTQKETINKMSKYCVELAKMGFVVIGVQHQAQAQESILNQQLNKVEPSIDGLGDDKTTARDAHIVFGLFSPSRFSMPAYSGYDITVFKDSIRFLSIITARKIRVDGVVKIPLLFKGDSSDFEELPLPTETEKLNKVINKVKQWQSMAAD